jgi:hypothetical protein
MKAFIAAVVLGMAAVGATYGVESTNAKEGAEAPAAQQKVAHWSGYVAMLKPETIVKKLGDAAPSEDQQAKIKALREQTMQKVQAWGTRADVMQVREELARAKKANDTEAIKSAEAKLKEVGDGSEFVTAYKEGLAGILSAEQMAKLYPPKKEAEKGEGKAKGKEEKEER